MLLLSYAVWLYFQVSAEVGLSESALCQQPIRALKSGVNASLLILTDFQFLANNFINICAIRKFFTFYGSSIFKLCEINF